MKMKNVREIARQMNVRTEGMDKTELIRAIQNAEGNIPCYATRGHECDQINCLWRDDCISAFADMNDIELPHACARP